MTRLRRCYPAALTGALLLGGCHRQVHVPQAPAPPPLAIVSVPPPTHPTEPEPQIPLAEVPNIEPQLPRQPSRRYRQPAATAAQMAMLTPPVAPVDLGQLTTGGEAENSARRKQTEDLLLAQLRRLLALPRSITVRHGQQVDQVKLFLQQANEAWKKLDVEGTNTLATKAKVILDEIQG